MLKEKQSHAESVLLLKTQDRYSDESQIHSLFYRQHGNDYVVAASNETDNYKPVWYLNLKEEPVVEIEVDGVFHFAKASTPTGAERMQIWPLVEELSANVFKSIPRNITGVVLSPMD